MAEKKTKERIEAEKNLEKLRKAAEGERIDYKAATEAVTALGLKEGLISNENLSAEEIKEIFELAGKILSQPIKCP